MVFIKIENFLTTSFNVTLSPIFLCSHMACLILWHEFFFRFQFCHSRIKRKELESGVTFRCSPQRTEWNRSASWGEVRAALHTIRRHCMRIDVSTINAIDAWNSPCILMFFIYCKDSILNIRHNVLLWTSEFENWLLH